VTGQSYGHIHPQWKNLSTSWWTKLIISPHIHTLQKVRKDKLVGKTCLLLLDFAEKYHYIVQDELQGYHWNKEQCTCNQWFFAKKL